MNSPLYWGLVAAAGQGRRMARDDLPKQYHRLAGRSVLAWSVDALRQVSGMAGVMVVRARGDDSDWARLGLDSATDVRSCRGGHTRQASVLAGLEALRAWGAADGDRVLVHDAARPAVTAAAIQRLIEAVGDDRDGGLLAVPVRDTLKRADEHGRVSETADRTGLWQAMTPQLFPLGRLRDALVACADMAVTDEAQAMERGGARPRLVIGDPANIKYTYPDDARWLEHALQDQRKGGDG
ncbi:2-C-methyl-D-erythritol 4-phosphate cytidylyltransferase [Spiribacter onubensis]|uniref:2-C-methyl-D-erythritol 4-phosphate cytidylyltransferase n=1 Tax=Spiribacter onubensis TaxID=3122420 RepID=A0ABV3S7S3_9GAMM